MATSTMLSPSTYDFQNPFKPADTPSSMVNPRQRPKLSLNTSGPASKRTFGKSSTGLRLDTLTDSSPTTRNTCQNVFGSQTNSPTSEPFRGRPRKPLFPLITTTPATRPSDSPVAPSTPTALTNVTGNVGVTNSHTSNPGPNPYTLPVEVRSILLNGPITKRERPPPTPLSAEIPSELQKESSPVAKRVCFRDPVEEEIQTAKYLLRHSDLRSRSVSPALSTSGPATSHSTAINANPAMLAMTTVSPPRAREIALALGSEDEPQDKHEAAHIASTPVAGRNPKNRDWRWTLGPLPKISIEGAALFKIDSHSDEEDIDDSLAETVAAAGGFQASRRDQEPDDA